jgi:hypothetical protein
VVVLKVGNSLASYIYIYIYIYMFMCASLCRSKYQSRLLCGKASIGRSIRLAMSRYDAYSPCRVVGRSERTLTLYKSLVSPPLSLPIN